MRKYLINFAIIHGLEYKEDNVGNILITRPPSDNFKNRKTVVLQSHMDMVGEKNADHPHRWLEDPIIPVLNDGWVSAQGTTLGADDGIGIAAQMAVLTDKDLESGSIECLFTVDEESGMTGAVNLDPDFFSGRILLNLDSEDEGILFIGCAGGLDTVGTLKFKAEEPGKNKSALAISVTGLRGGHSGDEIHKGYGNSVKIMNRLLWNLGNNFNASLSTFNGGNLRNAIPREAFAVIVTDKQDTEDIKKWVNNFSSVVYEELGNVEKDLKISVTDTGIPATVMDRKNQEMLLNSLTCCPHGVITWSKEFENLVETSTNLASVKFNNDIVQIVTTQRSSIESAKYDAAAMVETCLKLGGADITHSEGYPGWKPNLRSEILRITRNTYEDLFNKTPEITVIHAGLECGLIYEKNKYIDMISFGPTIRGAHTPDEKIEVASVQMFWELLNGVIKNIPEES